MAVPTIPGLVGTSSPTVILSQSARKFSSYQHPTVEKALQVQSELPKRQDVIWSVVVLVLSLGFLGLSFSGYSAMKLARSRAVVELLEVVGWQRMNEGLLILAARTILGLLSLTYSASLYNFIKLYTTASTFTALPPKPQPALNGRAPLLSSGQLALLFPSAASQSAKALANLSNTVRSVSETPAQASHLAASVLKKTKVVLHDAASSAAHRFGGSTSTGEGAPQTSVEPKPASPPAKPPLLAPLHPEIQRATGGSTMALWGSDGKVLTDANQSAAGALPGKASPAFGQSPFVGSPFSPAPFTQPATPPSQSQVIQTPKGGSEREKGFTSLQSEEDLDNFLADLDRRMETPGAQSPSFGTSPESGQKLNAQFMLTGAPGGAFSPVGAGFSPGYFAQQSPRAGGSVGTGMYPQTPPAQSPIFGVPAGTTPSAMGSQQQAVGLQSSPYSPSPSPAPYAPSAPPLPVQSQQQSPISTAPGLSPYGATTPAYASPGGFQQPSFQTQQPQTPSPYSVGATAYASPAPSVYSPYNQTPGSTGQYPINPQGNAAYPMTPPSAYGQSSNLSATPGSPYGVSPYQTLSANSPFQGGQVVPASSPLPPSGRPFVRSSPSQPKPGVLAGVKADREMPGPMPPEVLQRRLKGLGVLPRDLDEWRDELRVWFAEKLLGPLVRKMDESPSKVQSATSSLNIALPVALAPLGTDSKAAEAAAAVTAASLAVQAPPSEEQVLKLLGEKLVEEKKKAMQPASPAPMSMFGQAQAQQQGPSLPLIQACLDAVTENQRLRLLLRGDLASNVLPLPTVQPAFTARRIRELAEGACVKRYDWSGGADVIPGQQPWTAAANLPGDAHLLFYLFTTFLEFPGWSLHQEPITGPGHQGGFFFVGDLPKRLPEQFVAILQAPLTAELRAAVRQPKATVVLVGKQSPAPVFYLLWEGKFQFVIQGRTAIWDTIALLTYRLKQSHGGAIRGVSLNSSTMDLLPSIQTPLT